MIPVSRVQLENSSDSGEMDCIQENDKNLGLIQFNYCLNHPVLLI